MMWVVVLFLPLLVTYLVVASSRGGLINPDGLFVLFQVVALLGTLSLANPAIDTDRRYAYVVLAGTSLYMAASCVARISWGPRTKAKTFQLEPIRLTAGVWALYLLSLFVSAAYFAAIGHITVIDSLSAGLTGSTYDAATARLASYAGSVYFFPGYVNQFKNSILPILTFAIVHSLWARRVGGRLVASILMMIPMLVALAGTGQRAPTVIVFLIALVAAYRARLLSAARIVVAGVIGFGTFSVLTAAIQRQATQLEKADGAWDRMSIFGQALWSRIFLENPAAGLAAFHYTESMPTAWGREWGADILGVLPGYRGSDLANRVFEMLYGTPRGTAPASLWGGMYYNFAAAGSIVVTVAIALTLCVVTRRYFTARGATFGDERPLNALSVLALSGVAVSTGAWVAGSPLTILNQGVVAYLLVYWMSRYRRDPVARAKHARAATRTLNLKDRTVADIHSVRRT